MTGVDFVWRSRLPDPPTAVHLAIARVTDRDRWRAGLMEFEAGAGQWHLSVDLPDDFRGAYCFREFHDRMPDEAAFLAPPWADALGPGLADPLNPAPALPGPRGGMISELELPHAPLAGRWKAWGRPLGGRLSRTELDHDGETHVVRGYTPADHHGPPAALLVLTDGQSWFGRLGLPEALDQAIAEGSLPPLAVAGIEAGDREQRLRRLGGNADYLGFIADRVVPWARTALGTPVERAAAIFAGQSLGGLTGLLAAVDRPETFGSVIAQSPSVWWRPGITGRPPVFGSDERSWILDRLRGGVPPAGAGRPPVRVILQSGTLEGATPEHGERLAVALRAAGHRAEASVFSGGHEALCWRAGLLEALLALEIG